MFIRFSILFVLVSLTACHGSSLKSDSPSPAPSIPPVSDDPVAQPGSDDSQADVVDEPDRRDVVLPVEPHEDEVEETDDYIPPIDNEEAGGEDPAIVQNNTDGEDSPEQLHDPCAILDEVELPKW